MCKNLCAKFTPYHKEDKHDIEDRFHVFSVRRKNRSLINLSKLSDKGSIIYPQTYDPINKCKSLSQLGQTLSFTPPLRTGVKRGEPRSGSERFLDSLSRIPEGNPTTNDTVSSEWQRLPENVCKPGVYRSGEKLFDTNPVHAPQTCLEIKSKPYMFSIEEQSEQSEQKSEIVQQPCEEASMDQEDFPLSMDDNVQLEPSYNWFCNQISPTLAKELDMDTHYVADKDVSDWHPPTTHGLNNSSRVFPEYYLTGKVLAGNLLEIDFYFTIVDDIRNLRKLSPYQQTFIRSLPDEKKQELLEEYRACVESIIDNILSEEN